nr:hypothetical protein [Saprospiraceae bacterium]
MSNLLDKIKSLFVVEMEDESIDNKSSQTEDNEKDTPREDEESGRELKEEAVNNPAGKPSNDFLAILINAMQSAAKEEGIYLDFKQNLKSLNHLDFDLKTKYETAYAIAKNQGIDKEDLMRSAQFFLAVLDRENEKFEETLNLQRNRRIIDKKEEIKTLRDQIFSKQNEIEKIQDEIRQLESTIQSEKDELNDNRKKIEKTVADFESSLNLLKSKIQKDLEHFNNYLKE